MRVKVKRLDSSATSVKITDPLCTLFVTFCDMDNPQKEITTSHVFSTKQQRQYPQTRKVVYGPARGAKKYLMQSPASFVDQSEDELEMYERRRLGSTGQSYSGKSSSTATPSGIYSNHHIVQEVSLSYSAPYTSVKSVSPPTREVPLTVAVSQGDRIDEYGNVNRNGSLQDYLSHYETRITKPRHIESVDRVNARGRHETEFPVRIAFIGGESISPPPVHSVPIIPVGPPVRIYDSRASTQRIGSSLSDTIISETTTIEELTTITTTNHRREPNVMPMSPTSVNALTQQFEQSSRKEYSDATLNRKGQKSPSSGTRVVVVTKPGPEFTSYSSDEARIRRVDRSGYSPSDQRGIISTTIVDIEPAGYRTRPTTPRYVEETYQVQEEYRTIKTYGGSGQKKYETEVTLASPDSGRRVIKESVRDHISVSRSSSPSREPEQEQSRGATPVRSVVEQFESKIETESRRPKPYGRAESIDEYIVERKEVKEKPKEVYIPRGEFIPRPAPIAVMSPKPTPEVVIPKAVQPPPPPPQKEIHIPRNEPSRTQEKVQQFTDRTENVKVDEWEEVTTTTRRVEQPKEEPKPEEPKQDDMSLRQSQSGSAMHSSSSYSASSKSSHSASSASHGAAIAVSGGVVSGGAISGGMAEYSSSISSRPAFNTNRTVVSSSSSYGGALCQSAGGRSLKITEIGSSSLSGLSPFGQNAASAIRDAREREKKEMSDLNDRLASYIEKVRFLEAQNRKLATDLDLLQSRWGSDTTSVRVMYESELKTAKVVIEESNRQRDALDAEIRRLMVELTEYRKKYEEAVSLREGSRNEADGLLARLGEIEAEINLVKRRIVYVEEEVARIKRENQRLMGELSRHRTVIEQESLTRIDFQNQVQTLLEECTYVGRVHTTELGDLVVMAHRDTTPENREFFKNELAAAIRDIRAEYDQISHATRHDMESWYKLKVQEIHTQSSRTTMEQTYAREEVKKLRVTLSEMRSKLADLEGRNVLLEKQIQELNYQLEDDQRSYEAALNDRDASIRKMREECQALMVELQMLLDTKQTLDAEIAIYRKMLEGEENRAGLRQLVEQVVRTTSYATDHAVESHRVIKSESSSRSNFQRSALGNVAIHEVSPDGRFIIIENTHRSKEENIGEWKLKRRIDGKKEHVYVFPRDFVLKPLKSLKIFARGQGVHSPPDSLVFDGDENWGTGNSVQTYLYNKDGEERATHIQRQSYN